MAIRSDWDNGHMRRGAVLEALDRPAEAVEAFEAAVTAAGTTSREARRSPTPPALDHQRLGHKHTTMKHPIRKLKSVYRLHTGGGAAKYEKST